MATNAEFAETIDRPLPSGVTVSEPTPARAGAVSLARVARSGEVLELVRTGRAVTTSQLASIMGLARSTVSERVDLLLQEGLLLSAGEPLPGRGRPPTVLAFNARAGLALAAQIGMSGTQLAVTGLDGEPLLSRRIDLDIRNGPDAVLTRIEEAFDSALAELGESREKVHGVGVGVPGSVELATVRGPDGGAAGEWIDYPIGDRLAETFGAPAFVDQDVNLMALGEHRAHWPDSKVFMCVKVGTVIACGLVIDGQVVRGAGGLAGEIGHTRVPGSDAQCMCGNRGCLNVVAGGGALAQELTALGYDAPTAREVSLLASSGVVDAAQAIRRAGRQIGDILAGAINLLNLDVITLWGYLADGGEPFIAGMHEGIVRGGVPASTRGLRLERARLGDNAGIRGAAMAVLESSLAPDAIDRHLAKALGRA